MAKTVKKAVQAKMPICTTEHRLEMIHRNGFSLIEMMIVIALIATMATLILPRMIGRQPSTEWPSIVDDLNNLVIFARQEAISSQGIYRLTFKSVIEGRDLVLIEQEKKDPEKPQQKIYEQVSSSYLKTRYKFPEAVKIKALYAGREEMLSDNKGTGHCYIISDGLVQDVFLHLTRTPNEKDKKEINVTLKMMPFFGRFELLDGFIRPGRES
jgi:prepilin-type N-terminal cleavage/methylation domain-containing protein